MNNRSVAIGVYGFSRAGCFSAAGVSNILRTDPAYTNRKAGEAMSSDRPVYIGTDGGATTSKVGGVWADGAAVSTRLLQRATNAGAGPEAVVHSWVEAVADYLEPNGLAWDQVRRRRFGDPWTVPALRRPRPLGQSAVRIHRLRCSRGL